MSARRNEIESLREALAYSPENVPLRCHLGELLLAHEAFEEAEKEFLLALKIRRNEERALLGVARAYYGQGKHGAGLAALDEALRLPSPGGEIYFLQARLLLATGKPAEACDAYRLGLQTCPEAADKELGERLGIADAQDPEAGRSATSDVVDGKLRAQAGTGADERRSVLLEKPKIDFASVGGMEEIKQEIRMKIIYPLKNKDLYAAYGKKIGGGILMYGPPGCGKTYLARATAGEIKSSFMMVGLHDVLDMWIGQSEQKLHGFFEQAREAAPCVLFFDEVDALAASRSDLKQYAGRFLINQFLDELDGAKQSNEGVLILAATNAPWHLDPAFRRPGRFDRILFVPPPDAPARTTILRLLLDGKPLDEVDYNKLAKKTEEFTGADLKAMVDMAIEAALERAMKTGRPDPLSTNALLDAAKRVRPSAKEWFGSARNYALYANESGLYEDVLRYLNIKK